MNKSSLRRQLVLPYVALVLFVSAAIGWVSYQAGEQAVRTLSQRVLADAARHIAQATEQHFKSAQVVLDVIAPDARILPGPNAIPDTLTALEPRLWLAAALFPQTNNYAYFGGVDGRFIGLERPAPDIAELYLREPGAARRTVYAATAPGARARVLRTDDYDPRQRPWYTRAVERGQPVWSSVYRDFTTGEPTITFAKPVYAAGRIAGVAATDLTLKALADFLRTLNIGTHGAAFLIDADGFLIASSTAEPPFKLIQDQAERIRPAEMGSTLIRAAHAELLRHLPALAAGTHVELADAENDIAAMRLGREHGLDWTVVVAVPRADFTAGVRYSVLQSVFIAVVCVVLALVLGLSLLNRLLRDIRQLSDAVKRVGTGEPLPSLNLRRRDELGQIALSFSEMEHNLRIDKLTAVFNRASLIAQIGALRRQLAQKGAERPTFALLFIDLDHFKKVNDQYGHGAGDRVLVTVATRLKESVRMSDVVARYGGDEFVVLLKGVTNADDVIAMECKIRQIVEEPVSLEHGTARVGVSIGWALFPADGEDIDALLKIADMRMFDTKRSRKAERPAAESAEPLSRPA